jgi:chitinase
MNFKIIAYFPSWTGNVDDIPFDKITHVNYSFILPTPNGGLTEVDEGRLTRMVTLAHARGVKACIAIGGWNDGDCSAFEAMSAGSGNRRTFIRNVLEFCDRYQLDGVDIDWEYPKPHSAADCAVLIKELRAALGPKRMLSVAVIAEGDQYGACIRPEIFSHIDCLNIMAYDWYYQAPGTNHSSMALADSCLDYWIGRGCPREKAVLGVPFYGRSHNTAVTYRELVAKDPMAPYKDHVGEVLYNGLESMRKKTRIAMSKAGGIMFWEVTQDTLDHTSLLRAIRETAGAARPA